MLVYIIRHGESKANNREIKSVKGYIPDSNVELSINGESQAYDAGIFLRDYFRQKDYISSDMEMWVSPFLRTRKTAQILNSAMKEKKISNIYEDPRLAEQDFGDFEMQFLEDWKNISPHSYYINQVKYNDPHARFFARLENGENPSDVYNRLSIFVETRLLKSNKEKIIVTHGYAGLILEMYLLKLPIEWMYYEKVPNNCSIRVLEFANNMWKDLGYIH